MRNTAPKIRRFVRGEGRGGAHQLKEGVHGVLGTRVLVVVRDQVLGRVDAVHVLLVVQQPCACSRQASAVAGAGRDAASARWCQGTQASVN